MIVLAGSLLWPLAFESNEKGISKSHPQTRNIVKPSNSYICVSQLQGKTNLVEPWYSTDYSQEDVPSEWLSGWLKASPNDSIHLPKPNPFISSEFGLIDVSPSLDLGHLNALQAT